ncbi:hypothetical protein [Actinomadura logoneensis]|uniref:hypothetical protein n=1 Tax=Actinomadura logoneensis TaxID=2293572 RepID=UPI0018F18DC9|nr:hypothetical protein [Actinomadura logoneensis]
MRNAADVPEAVLDDLAWADAVLCCTDPIQFKTGNPYGTSHVAGTGAPSEDTLQAARHQAGRVVETAAALKADRSA